MQWIETTDQSKTGRFSWRAYRAERVKRILYPHSRRHHQPASPAVEGECHLHAQRIPLRMWHHKSCQRREQIRFYFRRSSSVALKPNMARHESETGRRTTRSGVLQASRLMTCSLLRMCDIPRLSVPQALKSRPHTTQASLTLNCDLLDYFEEMAFSFNRSF